MKKIGWLMIGIGCAVAALVLFDPHGLAVVFLSLLFSLGFIGTGVAVLTGILDPTKDDA